MSRREPYDFGPAPARSPKVWRSLEQKHRDPQDDRRRAEAEAESPGGLIPRTALTRRGFMTATGATAAAVGLEGCIRRPVENILPFSEAPEYAVPGEPLHFATVTQRRGDAIGLLVTSHEGRPTKIEGNPRHPGSRGATDVYGQASILDLYDPDRSASPAKRDGEALTDASYEQFDEAFSELLREHEADEGARLRVLMQPTNSPSVLRMRQAVKARLPQARFHTYASVNESNELEGARLAFGRPLRTLYALSRARTVLSLDSDFLGSEPGTVRNARAFASTRAPGSHREPMSRLYVVEGTFSITGASADHRLRVASRDVGRYLKALAKDLAARHGVGSGSDLERAVQDASAEGFPEPWIGAVADELASHRGRAPILVGSRQPAWVHALAHALNEALGNTGQVVGLFEPPDPEEGDHLASLESLVGDIRGGRVGAVVILGGNPVYEAPADLELGKVLETDGLVTVHLSSHRDETSQQASWHVPRAHELEAWGDQRALDGVVSIQQPLIRPLFGGRSDLELLAMMAGRRNWRGHRIVRETMRERVETEADEPAAADVAADRPSAAQRTTRFEQDWRRTLHGGLLVGSRPGVPVDVFVRSAEVAEAVRSAGGKREGGPGNLEVAFVPDPALFDGRHANNPWMLELPHPLTRVVWDNPALLSPQTARELGVETGDVVKLTREGRSIEIAAFVLPGHPDWTITLPLGWGRRHAGRYARGEEGKGTGFDVGPLRTTDGFHFADGVKASKSGRQYELASLQEHGDMEGRPIAIDATRERVDTDDPRYKDLPAYTEQPQFASFRSVQLSIPPLWKVQEYPGVKWGMSIDLSACTGCNACVVACQAENNIPVVGKQQASFGRAMHWIRVDRYFVGDDEGDPLIALQPVTCQHCEQAPCENVCPVNATTHSPEGLNDMAYNRCVGTRYCMNNCPYKVRRFNYLGWNGHLDDATGGLGGNYGDIPELHKMQKNPNVSVRFRGVMEKCTYCVQRIQAARVEARANGHDFEEWMRDSDKRGDRPGRELEDEPVWPACAQACPSRAISFGDLNDPNARVTKRSKMDRQYKLLAEVGTQPRTTYLGKIRNPNPAMLPRRERAGEGESEPHAAAGTGGAATEAHR